MSCALPCTVLSYSNTVSFPLLPHSLSVVAVYQWPGQEQQPGTSLFSTKCALLCLLSLILFSLSFFFISLGHPNLLFTLTFTIQASIMTITYSVDQWFPNSGLTTSDCLGNLIRINLLWVSNLIYVTKIKLFQSSSLFQYLPRYKVISLSSLCMWHLDTFAFT